MNRNTERNTGVLSDPPGTVQHTSGAHPVPSRPSEHSQHSSLGHDPLIKTCQAPGGGDPAHLSLALYVLICSPCLRCLWFTLSRKYKLSSALLRQNADQSNMSFVLLLLCVHMFCIWTYVLNVTLLFSNDARGTVLDH